MNSNEKGIPNDLLCGSSLLLFCRLDFRFPDDLSIDVDAELQRYKVIQIFSEQDVHGFIGC